MTKARATSTSEWSKLFDKSERLLVLTGAGVSVDSGIPDFQTVNHSWAYEEDRYSVLSLPFFRREPERFWEIYRELFLSKLNAQPNGFHYWLAGLEKTKEVKIITQNVDGLHQKAGSSDVIEAHGSISRVICLVCEKRFPVGEFYVTNKTPQCLDCGAYLKPDVSLFFEGVQFGLNDSRDLVVWSDILLVAGTSLTVGPVNEIPHMATYYVSRPSIWVNKAKPPKEYDFTYEVIGELGDFVQLVQ